MNVESHLRMCFLTEQHEFGFRLKLMVNMSDAGQQLDYQVEVHYSGHS